MKLPALSLALHYVCVYFLYRDVGWGPLALYSASPEALPKFGTFSELYQLYQLYALLASQITIYILTYLYVRVYKFNFLSYS